MDGLENSAASPSSPETYVRSDILVMQASPIERLRQTVATAPGVISLETGQSDISTPDFICDAAKRAMQEGRTFYSHGRGILPLRQAIAAYHNHWHDADLTEERVAVTLNHPLILLWRSLG